MMKNTVIAAVVTLSLSVIVGAQAPQGRGGGRGGQPVQPIQQVKPGLYVVAGAGANSLVRPTNEGVILIDTKLPGDQNYMDLMTQIRSVTQQPVKFVIVTHHHADHTGNIDKFVAAGANVLGHESLKKNLETYQFEPKPAPPTVTYNRDYSTVKLGGVEVQVIHYGNAHTSGDSVVYFPDLKVVATSDAVTTGGQGPLIDYAGGGTARGFQQVLAGMLTLDFDAAVPGNGPVLTKADIQSYKTKFDTVIERATELVKKGVPKDQLLMQIKTDDIGWAPRVPQIDAFYDELTKR